MVAYPAAEGRRATVSVAAERPGVDVRYIAPATVTASSVQADLGRLGRIDMVVRRTGGERAVHLRCVPRYAEEFRAGTLEGTFAFRGEGGYTAATAAQIRLAPPIQLQGLCRNDGGSGTQFGRGLPGALVRGVSFSGGRTLRFVAGKRSQSARTIYDVALRERRGGISITREAKGSAPPSALAYQRRSSTATLSPSAPFTGSATIRRSPDAVSPIFDGGLAVSLPGKPRYPLAGPQIHIRFDHIRVTEGNGISLGPGF